MYGTYTLYSSRTFYISYFVCIHFSFTSTTTATLKSTPHITNYQDRPSTQKCVYFSNIPTPAPRSTMSRCSNRATTLPQLRSPSHSLANLLRRLARLTHAVQSFGGTCMKTAGLRTWRATIRIGGTTCARNCGRRLSSRLCV